MNNQGNIDKLKTTPVTELNLGSASLRRVIKRAGFDTLPELLDLSEKEIDDLFDSKDADAIVRLQEQHRANPEEFALGVLRKKEIDVKAVNKTISKAKASYAVPRNLTTLTSVRSYNSDDCPIALPPLPFSDALVSFENRAREVLNDLVDRFEDVMVYQAFEEFSTDLDELSDAFSELFAHYSNQPRTALSLIDRHLRNAFVIYVADRARSVYSDGNLWGNFFERLRILDSNVQSLFKQTFVNHIERREMPLYARDEEAYYYFYTALLHGGLSADSWSNLWEKCILPLAKEVAAGNYGFGGEMDGHSILRELKNPESQFAPNKAVLNILEKAPDSTIAPLFEASMRVAVQLENSKDSRGDCTMLSNFGLPEAALDALRESQGQSSSLTGSRSASSHHEERQKAKGLLCLSMATLQLDLAEGIVSLHWPRQQFPLHFAGARIDYYVDGKMELSSEFGISVGKCILEASSIIVEPQARYDVELKLMQKDEQTGEYVQVSSLNQTFTRNKPGCFEFIKSAKGIYRLRGRNERILKKRRVAYIVKDEHMIQPGQGMSEVSEYETSGGWNDTRIFVYDIDPGSSGSVVNSASDEVIAVWQERYVAKIDKRRIIGETASGIDLYGYVPCELGTNGGLPSVTIETIDGLAALDDLDIICICDGQRISMPRHVVWADDHGESIAAQIALVPKESSLFDWHIEECLIEARQKSAGGKAVFRYRFAVAPIQDFKLTSIDFDSGIAIAEYEFQARIAVEVTEAHEKTETVNAWSRYSARTLLKDEFLLLRIRSIKSGKETDAKLALAAVDIKIPDTLLRISKEHPICLADALELGPSAANLKIISYGWRYNRAAIVMLGSEPIFLKELKRPGEHEFNLFRFVKSFQQADDSKPRSRPLRVSLVYGDDVSQGYLKPAWTYVKILDCVEGIGISGWRILVTKDGNHVLRFDGQPLCDISFEFKRRAGRKPIAETSVDAGAEELILPSNVVRLLHTKKTVIVEVSPLDWLQDAQREYATMFTLKR